MIEYSVYLKNKKIPMFLTSIYCDNCDHRLNAGPTYHPKFCDMCGYPIKDNLKTVNWKFNEATWYDYCEYMVDAYPEYIIMKVIFEYTDYGRIGMPRDIAHIPVMIGRDIEEILAFMNEHSDRIYDEDDLEPATEEELLAYAKTCGNFWKG